MILWKNKLLSQKELEFFWIKIIDILDSVAIVEADENTLKNLAWITKYWELIDREIENFEQKKLIITNSPVLWKQLKDENKISRFKLVELWAKDIEANGNEFLVHQIFWAKKIWKVLGYQNIKLYETADFEKPARWMEIGMMPAKLTHLLINYWLAIVWKWEKTIYDPFSGFWTTGLLANALWHNFIGSDINITSLKQNMSWRKTTNFATDKKILIYKHDVKQKFEKKFLKNVDVIITEGWLWNPVKNLLPQTIKDNQKNILNLLEKFLTNTKEFFPRTPIVMSWAVYLTKPEEKLDELEVFAKTLNYNLERLQQIYFRKGQKVGREILIFVPK